MVDDMPVLDPEPFHIPRKGEELQEVKPFPEIQSSMGNEDAEKNARYREHVRKGHQDDFEGHCDTCARAKMRAKPVYNISRSIGEQKEVANLDLMDMKQPGIDGNRYPLNCVVYKSRLGMSRGLPKKESIRVANKWGQMKHWVESRAGPGG